MVSKIWMLLFTQAFMRPVKTIFYVCYGKYEKLDSMHITRL